MQRLFFCIAVAFSISISVVGIAGAAPAVQVVEDDWKLPTEEPRLKAGVGSELTSVSCVLCHSVDYITTQPPLTREQWKAAITKMQQKFGAPIGPEKVDPLLEYLVKNYGK